MTTSMQTGRDRAGAQSADGPARAIPIVTLGLSLSAFFVITYVICILGYLLLPGFPVQHEALAIFLPGFTLLSWQTYFLGLVESFVWGWYIAVMFGLLYNFSPARARRASAMNKAAQNEHDQEQPWWRTPFGIVICGFL